MTTFATGNKEMKMTSIESILSQLNPEQQAAVKQIEGPVGVVAGAGSGKTRVLTYRIAYMLSQGISPYSILALTFTNKAADEMRGRVNSLISGSDAKAVTLGTFHSVFLRILKVECSRLGFSGPITVYDTDDSKNMLKSIVKDMSLDPKVYVPKVVLSRISSAKTNLIPAEEYVQNYEIAMADKTAGRPQTGNIFLRYSQRLKNANAMDFDDLIYYMNVLLRDFPDLLYKYQNRFSYILVDEYQDTNYAQYLIINKLAADNHNICVVGDDAQSIYGFRGANIQNILNFNRDYPEAKIIKLEQNYRSTKNIISAANAVIRRNVEQMPKKLWSDNDVGRKISLIRANTDSDEGISVARSIFEIKMNEHAENRQFAVLYRTNTQSRVLEEAFVKQRIPYVVHGGTSFYKRKEIKDILAYFRLVINHYDEESLLRTINFPLRGIGEATMARLRTAAKEHNVPLWEVVVNPEAYGAALSQPVVARIDEFASMIINFSFLLPKADAYELANEIVTRSGIVKFFSDDSEEKDRWQHVEELMSSIRNFTEQEPESNFNIETGELIESYFPTLDHFVESIALMSDEHDKGGEDDDKVKLMTIHSAKGLEFDYVFVTGMEENLFPSALSMGSRSEIEEERRLFYVALTRARKLVTLTCAKMRMRFGEMQFCEESRFIDEIPEEYLNITRKASEGRGFWPQGEGSGRVVGYRAPWSGRRAAGRPAARPAARNAGEVQTEKLGRPAAPEQVAPGLRVYHATFGFGTVQFVDGRGPDAKAVVVFETVGSKTLMLKFAKLSIPK